MYRGGCRRTSCIMGQRVNLHSLLKPIGVGVATASLHKAWCIKGFFETFSTNEDVTPRHTIGTTNVPKPQTPVLCRFYPKPGDLAMGRLKGG